MMKKCSMFLFLLVSLLTLSSIAGATTYTFQPGNSDLWDLDHHYYYTWGFQDQDAVNLVGSNAIKDISIRFAGIYDWSSSDYSNLFVWLLNNCPDGTMMYSDGGGNNSTIFDDFTSSSFTGTHLVTYETPDKTSLLDIPAGANNKTDLIYSFTQEQIDKVSDYIKDGNTVGLGFDPDCHYYNQGISLLVSVPEPATILLLGTGLFWLAGTMRKKRRIK